MLATFCASVRKLLSEENLANYLFESFRCIALLKLKCFVHKKRLFIVLCLMIVERRDVQINGRSSWIQWDQREG